jgi:serine/threonine protein kinase
MKHPLHIPGYDLMSRLGGGMVTSVYKARELAGDAVCAVKVLRPDWEDQPTAIKLMQREARAALAVRHPHLLTLRHAHVMKPPYFLVSDLLQGESLRGRLRRDYRLPVSEAVWVIRQVAEALAALHQAGFMHGDLKPDNVQLTGAGQAVLLDLGFAHRPGENAALLEDGYIMGTVEYLAPELCATRAIDDFAADLFSLGVMFFEMLSGRLPYERGSVRDTLRRHLKDMPVDIHAVRGDLPPALGKLVMRLLARQPAERPKLHFVVQQLIALEIASLHHRRAA